MKEKTKAVLSWVGLGVTTVVTVAVVAVVAYGIGYEDGHADATDDWFNIDDWFNG